MRFLIKHHSFKNYWKYWHLSKYVDCTHKCHFLLLHSPTSHRSSSKIRFQASEAECCHALYNIALKLVYLFVWIYLEHQYRAFEKKYVCRASAVYLFVFFCFLFLFSFSLYHVSLYMSLLHFFIYFFYFTVLKSV